VWAFECDMNMEKYEYEYIPPTDDIGNFMNWGREIFFPKIIIIAFQGILW